MNQVKNVLFITWEKSRRSKSLSTTLGIPLYQIDFDNHNQVLRYILCILQTIRLIKSLKPKLLICQNPSIILITLTLLVRPLFRYILFVDAHNAGVEFDKQNRFLKTWLAWIHRKSDITIVTNKGLEDVVKQNGGTAIILPDPLPQIDILSLNKKKLGDQFSICFICTFHGDEPYENVFDAMKGVPSSVSLYVTGKPPSKIDTTRLSSNIRLMGFLSEPDFWSLLYSVDIIMDLTMRDNCLVCGAYEGTALKKPLILSDTRATRDYFCTGAIYVQPDSHSIIDGINRAIEKHSILKNEIENLNVMLQNQYLKMTHSLKIKANTLVAKQYGSEVFYE